MGSGRDTTSLPAIAIAIASGATPPSPPPASSKSKLKPPSSMKLPLLVRPTPAKAAETQPGNQEADAASSRSLVSTGPRGSAVDKHRDFLNELEEQKRQEKERQSTREAKRRKLQRKLTEKILQEAARARQRQEDEDDEQQQQPPPPPPRPQEGEPQALEDARDDGDEKKQREKEAKRQRKRLLKKQQALLETLQTKKREKEEGEAHEREKERRRQDKLKKAVLDAIHAARAEDGDAGDGLAESPEEDAPDETLESGGGASEKNGRKKAHKHRVDKPTKHREHKTSEQEAAVVGSSSEDSRETAAVPAVGRGIAVTRPRTETRDSVSTAAAEDTTMGDKPRAKEPHDAVNKKQHEYLQKLADQRRLKQKEDDDAKLTQEKRRRRVQQEAQHRLHEAAAKQQQQRLQEEQEAAEQEPEEEKKVVVNVDAMVARLSKLKDKDALVVPEARDFASWKKRHGVRSDQKVFCMTGWYPVIKEELERRGWFFNGERLSPFFDLKWSLKSDDLKGIKLKEDQYVNHFFSNTAITTKVGLLHTLRGLSWHQSVDVDTLFPRAYDLNEPRDMDAFVADFRYSFAEGVLKEVAKTVVRAAAAGTTVRLNEAFVAVLLAVGKKKLRAKRAMFGHVGDDGDDDDGDAGAAVGADPLDDSVDDVVSAGGPDELVSDLEWEVVSKCQLDAPGKFRASLAYRRKVYADDRDSNVLPGDAAHSAPVAASGPVVVDTVMSALEKKQQRHAEKLKSEAFNREKARLSEQLARVSVLSSTACDELLRLTRALERACPQFRLNGGGDLASTDPTARSRNVWIVKPAGLSRGRGIRVFNQLDALLEYADVEHHKECQWVAQKYIENPLLICKRKFDIRQWVLVTSWDPLTVWIYEDFYLRFSSEEYSTDDLSDQYVHLTNNSIQKYSDKFHDVYATDDGGVHVEGNMLHSDDFKQYIASQCGVGDAHFEQTLHARMKEIVVQSLQCAQDAVQHRRHACELYGYDFMLDDALRPWLIEVNSSPACDYSTPTAQRYVATGLAGIVRVIVDHREFESRRRSGAAAATEPEPDTGRWRRIHKGEYIGKPVSSFGADFQVKGTKVQRTRGRRTATAVAPPRAVLAQDEEEEDEEEEARMEEERTGGERVPPEACPEEEATEDAEDEGPLPRVGGEETSIDSLL